MCLRVRVRACVRVCAGGSGEGSGERIKCGDIRKGEKTTTTKTEIVEKGKACAAVILFMC